MPFTAAHPAIVLPLIRSDPRVFSATGLIAGSVAPDFEYFFRMSATGIYGHTVWGLLYFDIPVSALLAVVFHGIVKNNLIHNSPAAIRSRLQPLLQLDFAGHLKKFLPAFLFSCWLGAASHVFWDNFTHHGGYFVQRLAIFENSVAVSGVNYPMFFVLQQVSTTVGLVVIGLYIFLMKRYPPANSKPSAAYWMIVSAVAALVVAARFSIRSSDMNAGNVIVTAIAAGCIGLVAGGLHKTRTAY